MSNKILILSAIVLAVVFSSCKKLFEDEELSMERVDYTGTELRTDGYYYYRYQYYNSREDSLYDWFIPWFLYRNGVWLYGGAWGYSRMEEVEKKFEDGSFYDLCKDDKLSWGVFQISDSVIEFEGWDSGEHLSKPTVKQYAKIVNDTTFCRCSKRAINDENLLKLGHWFHFKQFSPKPDSTNSFIK